MKLRPLLISAVLFLCLAAFIPHAYAQNESADSMGMSEDMSVEGRNLQADLFFFDAVKARMHDDDKLATELFLKYIALRPEVSAAYYELSKISYADRKLDKAEEYVKKAISLDPGNKWYHEQYAALLADKGAYDLAAKEIVGLMKLEPEDDNYPLIAAEYFSKARRYDDAITYLDKALVMHGNDENILDRKVQVYLKMNNVALAAETVKQKIAKDPKDGRYYRQLGDLYSNNKEFEKAKEVYRNAERLLPGDPDIQMGIAENYLNAGDTAMYVAQVKKLMVNTQIDVDVQLEIFGTYLRTLASDSAIGVLGMPLIRELANQHPDDDQVMFLYGKFLESHKKLDSAVIAYKQALEIKPNNPDLWRRLLITYTDRKYADSLIKSSEKAMRLFPNVAIYSYFNSIGYMNKKQYPQAINAIRRAIDMQPDNDKSALADMYSLLADEYHSSNQDDLSDKAFEKALELVPDNSSVLNNYSYYLSERGKNLDKAEQMSKKSLELSPDQATYLDTYGWIQYRKGNFLKAKDFIERAIRLMGDNADATLYDHLGNICYQLNDNLKAIEYWKKAKELGGDNPLLDKKISEGKLYE